MKKIDDLDRNVLSVLMKDAKTTYAEIGRQLFVSPGTVHVRVKKMEEMGIIKGHHLTVDYEKLGYDISAFLGIYLDKSSLYDQVAEGLSEIPEIVGVHYTTGLYGIFVKIICKDTTHLRNVLHDKIQQIKGIQRTETFISLEEGVNRPLEIFDEE